MALQPLLPTTGLTGWNYLKATMSRQMEVFDRSPDIQRDVEYLKENLKNDMSLDDFMADNRLLRISLSVHGLGEEAYKKAFVRKILEEGGYSQDAFAVRLNNPQYLDFTKMFDFSSGTLSRINTMDEIVQQYKDEMFEQELGNVDDNMRLALNFEREIINIPKGISSEKAGWYKVMGSLPLRRVMETALNLPPQLSQIDLEQQVGIFADRAEKLLGIESIQDFTKPEVVEKAIQRFFLNDQLRSGPSTSTPGSAALALLQGGAIGSGGLAGLISSF